MFFRKAEDLLSEACCNLLRENTPKLERAINIKSEKLLDYLVRDEVITENDKDSIMVRNYYYYIVIYISIMKENKVMFLPNMPTCHLFYSFNLCHDEIFSYTVL